MIQQQQQQSNPPPKPPKPPIKPPKPNKDLLNNNNNNNNNENKSLTSSSSPSLPVSPPSPAIYSSPSSPSSPTSPSNPPPKPPPPLPKLKSDNNFNSSINSIPPSSPSLSSSTSPSSISSSTLSNKIDSQSFSTIKSFDDSGYIKNGKKKSIQASLSQLTGLLGIGEQTEFSSKGYQNVDEANLRLAEINAALDGLQDTSEDEPNNTELQTQTLGEGLIREGFLYKTNRDGMEKYYFVLTSQYLSYCAEKILTTTIRLNHKRSIPLSNIMIRDANDDFRVSKNSSSSEMIEMKNKTLLILSKEKSFHLTASTIADRNQWFEDIERASRSLQSRLNITLNEDSMSPVWNPDYTVTACELCSNEFTFFFRRHHCRNCGKCLCENCCQEKCRIPRIDSRKLLLVCSICASQLKSSRTYGVPGYVPQK